MGIFFTKETGRRIFMKFLNAILITLALFVSTEVSAHKIKTAFTIILFNDRTEHIEVVHRFYLHDAEEAVWELFDKDADIIGSEKTQAIFTEYVMSKFALKDQDGHPIKLDTLGFQNEGGYFWVYQETPYKKDLTKLYIQQDALKDIWSEQYNVVNIEGLDQVYTLNFSDSDEWLSIPIKKQAIQ